VSRRHLLAVSASLAALLLAACSGGGSSVPPQRDLSTDVSTGEKSGGAGWA
jgi:hypothetical protein